MTKKWVVPVAGEPPFEITETVDLFTGDHVVQVHKEPNQHCASRVHFHADPQVAVQLGLMLCEASKESGQRAAKARSRRKARALPERNRQAHPQITERTLTMEEAWQLFMKGGDHGGDPGWHGGSSLADVEEDQGSSSAEQIEIRRYQRDVFLAWWNKG